MEEEYYNTQSIASGGGTTPQQFFYGVGLGSCGLALVWFYNNCYPVTNERLVTDAALAWCRAEVYSQRAFNLVSAIMAPFINLFRSNLSEPNLFFYAEDGSVVETTFQDFMNINGEDWDYNYIEYRITNDQGDSCCRIYRSTKSCRKPEDSLCNSSPFKAISVALKYNDKDDKPVEKIIDMPDCNYYIAGNTLFDRDFLEKTLKITDLPEKYTISILDNNVKNIILETNENRQDSIFLTSEGYNVVKVESNEADDDDKSNKDDCINSATGLFGWFGNNNNNKAKEE